MRIGVKIMVKRVSPGSLSAYYQSGSGSLVGSTFSNKSKDGGQAVKIGWSGIGCADHNRECLEKCNVLSLKVFTYFRDN